MLANILSIIRVLRLALHLIITSRLTRHQQARPYLIILQAHIEAILVELVFVGALAVEVIGGQISNLVNGLKGHLPRRMDRWHPNTTITLLRKTAFLRDRKLRRVVKVLLAPPHPVQRHIHKEVQSSALPSKAHPRRLQSQSLKYPKNSTQLPSHLLLEPMIASLPIMHRLDHPKHDLQMKQERLQPAREWLQECVRLKRL